MQHQHSLPIPRNFFSENLTYAQMQQHQLRLFMRPLSLRIRELVLALERLLSDRPLLFDQAVLRPDVGYLYVVDRQAHDANARVCTAAYCETKPSFATCEDFCTDVSCPSVGGRMGVLHGSSVDARAVGAASTEEEVIIPIATDEESRGPDWAASSSKNTERTSKATVSSPVPSPRSELEQVGRGTLLLEDEDTNTQINVYLSGAEQSVASDGGKKEQSVGSDGGKKEQSVASNSEKKSASKSSITSAQSLASDGGKRSARKRIVARSTSGGRSSTPAEPEDAPSLKKRPGETSSKKSSGDGAKKSTTTSSTSASSTQRAGSKSLVGARSSSSSSSSSSRGRTTVTTVVPRPRDEDELLQGTVGGATGTTVAERKK